MKTFTFKIKLHKKMTALAVVGSILFPFVVPPFVYASMVNQNRPNAKNHMLRKQLLSMKPPEVAQEIALESIEGRVKPLLLQEYRMKFNKLQAVEKIAAGGSMFASHKGFNQPQLTSSQFQSFMPNVLLRASALIPTAQTAVKIIKRTSALHAGTALDQAVMIYRNRSEHLLDISDDEFEKMLEIDDHEFVNIYFERYFANYQIHPEDLDAAERNEIEELIRQIELEFEEQANNAYKAVGLTRVKVTLWDGPGMVESEDVWMLAPLIIKDRLMPSGGQYVPYEWVRAGLGKSYIHIELMREWLKIKQKYGTQEMMRSVKTYVGREFGSQAVMDIQYESSTTDFDLAHSIIQERNAENLKHLLDYANGGYRHPESADRYDVAFGPHSWEEYTSLILEIIDGWSLDHQGLMDMGKRVANNIRLGDFADYIYVRDMVDSMFEPELPIPVNPIGLFGEFLHEVYMNVREGKNGVGEYAKALNDVFNLIRRDKELYLEYKKVMDRGLKLLRKSGKTWKDLELHKFIPSPGTPDSLQKLIKIIDEMERAQKRKRRGDINRALGYGIVMLSGIAIGQGAFANGLGPVGNLSPMLIDFIPWLSGALGLGMIHSSIPQDDLAHQIGVTAKFTGDRALPKNLNSVFIAAKDSAEEENIRFLDNVKDIPTAAPKIRKLIRDAGRDTGSHELVIVSDFEKTGDEEYVRAHLAQHKIFAASNVSIRILNHPMEADGTFNLESLVLKPENKLVGDGYALRIIYHQNFWSYVKNILKSVGVINGFQIFELERNAIDLVKESA